VSRRALRWLEHRGRRRQFQAWVDRRGCKGDVGKKKPRQASSYGGELTGVEAPRPRDARVTVCVLTRMMLFVLIGPDCAVHPQDTG